MIMRNLIGGMETQSRPSGEQQMPHLSSPLLFIWNPHFPLCNTILSLSMFLEFVLSFLLARIIFIWCIFVTMYDLHFKILLLKIFKLYILIMCFPLSNSSQIFPQLPTHPASCSLPSLSKRKQKKICSLLHL